MTSIAILGSGISGLGAANRLREERVDATIFDKNDRFGGHTMSIPYPGGFIFDIGPHVSFTSDKRIAQMLAENLDGEFEEHKYRFSNYWEGHWVGHPAQTNLHGLPPEVITQVITDFVEQGTKELPIRNYEDWLLVAYGRTFAEKFPGRYTFKYHTTEARNLTTDWMGPRMYRPKLEEILMGALAPQTRNVHYVQGFRYPKRGGFGAYLEKWGKASRIEQGHKVTRIDPKAKVVEFAGGKKQSYDGLVSSIPLNELVPMIAGAPQDVVAAAGRLACSACVLVNLGLARDDVSDTHVSYFYDLDVVFPRTSYPHLMSAGNVPAGCSSVQVELYFSPKYRPFTGKPADYIEPVIRDLVRCGVLRENERFLVKDAMYAPYANIIFDHERAAAVATVHAYLDEQKIRYCGRFGDWGYLWTDDSIKSGERAAELALGDCR